MQRRWPRPMRATVRGDSRSIIASMADWDMLSKNRIPPEPGSVPLPEGQARLWHYSNVDREPGDDRPWHQIVSGRADALRREGLRMDRSRTASYGEPSQIWAAAGSEAPSNLRDKIYVEFSASPKDLDIGSYSTASELEQHGAHVTMRKNVSPAQFIAVHEPWHAAARYILNDPEVLRDAQSGMHDGLMEDDPVEYGPAIAYAKSVVPKKGNTDA